jgi:hypothetical protein
MTARTKVAPLGAAGAAAGPDAARVAVQRALGDLGGVPASLVIAFVTPDLGAARAAAQAQAAAGDVPVVGLTSDACVGPPGLVRGGCTALALAAPLVAGVAVAENAERDPRAAGRAAAAEALAALGDATSHTVLLLFLDTRSGDQAETVAGAYAVTGGAIPFAGGAAAGDPPSQIALGRAYERAVVAVAIGSPEPIAVGMAHGCRPCSVPSIVTRSEGSVVFELDGRPAAEVYLEKHGRAGDRIGPDDFADFAAGHPLAQPELSGDVRLRHVLGREPGGGLRCATHIPANAAVHFTEQAPEAIIASTATAVGAACAGLGGAPPAAALVFDCGGRKHVLGAALEREAAATLEAFGPAGPPPVAGLYTRGEIGRVRGAKGDRNHALVVVAFA